jgi:hypothetical protein
MDTRLNVRPYLSSILLGAVVFCLLYLSRLYSYLLFHSLAELFAIVVAACVFMVIWNSRRLIENQYLLFLGIGSLFIAVIDLLHLLTYWGMGVLPDASADTATQLWLVGQGMQATALFIAPAMFGRRAATRAWFLGWTALALAMTALIYATDIFPSCLGADGPTTFKTIAEMTVSVALLLALLRLRRHAGRFQPNVLRTLSWYIGVAVFAETAFILAVDPYGPLSLLGHYLRIVGTYLLYKAIIETALTEPHKVLFR